MTQAHTKGPWEIIKNGKTKNASFMIMSPPEERGCKDIVARTVPDEANALLIAAAPELLNALILARPEIENTIKEVGPCEHKVGVCVCREIAALEAIDAAIKKAKGQ